MNGSSALTQEAPEGSVASIMGGHIEKMTVFEPGSESSPDTRSAGARTPDFPASGPMGK